MMLYFIIILCILLQAERGVFDTLSYIKLFKDLEENIPPQVPAPFILQEKPIVYILIPVLREQGIIETTIRDLCRLDQGFLDVRIIVIPTVREELEDPTIITTEQILKESLDGGLLAGFKDRIQIIKEMGREGNMASQLNYAIDKLRLVAPLETLFIVYNADSRISETTFTGISTLLQRHENIHFAFQQPCAYVKEMRKSSPAFLNALSLFQSWYCLGHESRLIRKYNSSKNGKRLGVIVGHGSGMSLGVHKMNGMYPTDLFTEDLTFGFILSANKVPILSLPALELADVPSQFATFIRQKSVWFWNYLGYFTCYKKMRSQGSSVINLSFLIMQGVAGGAYWFFSAFFIAAPIVASLILGHYVMSIVFLVLACIFSVTPQYMLFKKLPGVLRSQGFTEKAEEVSKVSFLRLLPALCLILVTDSVGAWIATYKYINSSFSGRLPLKYKTED